MATLFGGTLGSICRWFIHEHIENTEVKVKTGKQTLVRNLFPLQQTTLSNRTQKYGYVKDDTGKWVPGTTPEKEEATDALTVNASGYGKCSILLYRRIYL